MEVKLRTIRGVKDVRIEDITYDFDGISAEILGSEEVHIVTIAPEKVACSCPYFFFNKPVVCKHIAAVLLKVKEEEPELFEEAVTWVEENLGVKVDAS